MSGTLDAMGVSDEIRALREENARLRKMDCEAHMNAIHELRQRRRRRRLILMRRVCQWMTVVMGFVFLAGMLYIMCWKSYTVGMRIGESKAVKTMFNCQDRCMYQHDSLDITAVSTGGQCLCLNHVSDLEKAYYVDDLGDAQ